MVTDQPSRAYESEHTGSFNAKMEARYGALQQGQKKMLNHMDEGATSACECEGHA